MGRRLRLIRLIAMALTLGIGTALAGPMRADDPPRASDPENPLPPAIDLNAERPPALKSSKSRTRSRSVSKKVPARPQDPDESKTAKADDPAGSDSLKGLLDPEPPTSEPVEPKTGPTPPPPEPSPIEGPASPVPAIPAPPTDGVKLDAEVEKVQGPAKPAPAQAEDGEGRFLPDPERLHVGPQTLGLSVHVTSPQTLNLNKPATLKIVVKNTGPTEALGVIVRDKLPDNLTYLGSQPEAKRLDSLLTWSLGTVPAGADRTIVVNVTPTKVGAFDHAATVTMMGGGRSTTMVREPKLKVEQTVSSGKVLKGQSVVFRIVVSNQGDGPARNVVVAAKLSPGLRGQGAETSDQNRFDQTIDVINPGQRVELDALEADSAQGGEQSCVVVAQSPDVVPGAPEAKSVKTVSVVEPKLNLTLTGSDKRYTSTTASYEIKLKNPGTAPARAVKVVTVLPTSAQLLKTPPGATWNSQTRKLSWTRSQVDAEEEVTLPFQVRLGGPGLYQFSAEARGEAALFEKATFSTDVLAMADVQVEVTESKRVVDVGESTVFKILITNKGTKAATRIAVKAKLSETVAPKEIGGVDGKAALSEGMWIFPLVDHLDPGKQIELGIRVEAVKAGPGTCRVFVKHDDLNQEGLEDLATFTITDGRR